MKSTLLRIALIGMFFLPLFGCTNTEITEEEWQEHRPQATTMVREALDEASQDSELKNLTSAIQTLEAQKVALRPRGSAYRSCPPFSISCVSDRHADAYGNALKQQKIRDINQELSGYYARYHPKLIQIARENLKGKDKQFVERYFPEFYDTSINNEQLFLTLQNPNIPRPGAAEG